MQTSSAAKHDTFAEDVLKGLSSTPKSLSSKYFYDAEGSRLFRRIMELPEYYLTRSEFEIFRTQAADIYAAFTEKSARFDLLELGAGDGTKTALLIEHFLARKADFAYAPIDISAAAVATLTEKFHTEFPDLRIAARTGDYFRILETLKTDHSHPKIILFLGSNIGNFPRDEAIGFFRRLRAVMNPDDLLFTGFDLRKDPRVVLAAYDDAAGVTAAFNLNLLRRINRELGADFDLENFSHFAAYDPLDGAARSYLISRADQSVRIETLGRTFHFRQWEPIFMEISQKYSPATIAEFAAASGFRVERNFFDRQRYFVDSLWKVV